MIEPHGNLRPPPEILSEESMRDPHYSKMGVVFGELLYFLLAIKDSFGEELGRLRPLKLLLGIVILQELQLVIYSGMLDQILLLQIVEFVEVVEALHVGDGLPLSYRVFHENGVLVEFDEVEVQPHDDVFDCFQTPQLGRHDEAKRLLSSHHLPQSHSYFEGLIFPDLAQGSVICFDHTVFVLQSRPILSVSMSDVKQH